MCKKSFSMIPDYIYELEDISSTEKLLLITLFKFRKNTEEGVCSVWPSQNTLAKMCGFSRRAIVSASKSLAEKGYLGREKTDSLTLPKYLIYWPSEDLSLESFISLNKKMIQGCEGRSQGCERRSQGCEGRSQGCERRSHKLYLRTRLNNVDLKKKHLFFVFSFFGKKKRLPSYKNVSSGIENLRGKITTSKIENLGDVLPSSTKVISGEILTLEKEKENTKTFSTEVSTSGEEDFVTQGGWRKVPEVRIDSPKRYKKPSKREMKKSLETAEYNHAIVIQQGQAYLEKIRRQLQESRNDHSK